ncbi:MAG: hypothetical protein WDN04_09135 [Rhodospirillales bacterium]
MTDRRRIGADDYFQGMFTTALAADELVTSVEFPIAARANYEKFRNPASRYAIVGVFVAKGPAGVRVAVTGAGQGGVFRPFRDGGGANPRFFGGGARRRDDIARRSERRHPCERHLSRSTGGRDGAARGGGSLSGGAASVRRSAVR